MTKRIIIDLHEDGSLSIKTDIADRLLVRNVLKLAEEFVVTESLKESSKQEQRIVPVKPELKVKLP